MHPLSKFLSSVAAAGLIAAIPLRAQASQTFPGTLQDAAGMPCAPSCVLCHGVDPGTAGTFTAKQLGRDMLSNGANTPDDGKLKAAWAAFSAKPENAAVVTALQNGIDPETGANLCQLKYGCGARIAKDAPRDDWSGLLFVAGALGLGALLRRTKRR